MKYNNIVMKGVMTMSIKYNVMIQKEENWYVAKCLDNNVASQGKTIEEAMQNLKEALELYAQTEKIEQPKEVFITTLEVAI
jgi:predicted RNase H-like HicB family nuclease